jgi:hypothetical protein
MPVSSKLQSRLPTPASTHTQVCTAAPKDRGFLLPCTDIRDELVHFLGGHSDCKPVSYESWDADVFGPSTHFVKYEAIISSFMHDQSLEPGYVTCKLIYLKLGEFARALSGQPCKAAREVMDPTRTWAVRCHIRAHRHRQN